MRVLVRRLSEKPRGEKLHNRYILTDLGGVFFGIGLDDGDEGATDDVTLLDRDPYVVRLSTAESRRRDSSKGSVPSRS